MSLSPENAQMLQATKLSRSKTATPARSEKLPLGIEEAPYGLRASQRPAYTSAKESDHIAEGLLPNSSTHSQGNAQQSSATCGIRGRETLLNEEAGRGSVEKHRTGWRVLRESSGIEIWSWAEL